MGIDVNLGRNICTSNCTTLGGIEALLGVFFFLSSFVSVSAHRSFCT